MCFWAISAIVLMPEWQVWLEEYRQSDLSVKQFCEFVEVSVAAFYNWQRKFRHPPDVRASSETSLATPVYFVEAFISASVVSDHIEIRLHAGGSVSLRNEVSSLKLILQALVEIGANS